MGRTGVFITLSIVLERMRYEGAVDIFQTVKMLRTQRPAMVQTEVNPEQHAALTDTLIRTDSSKESSDSDHYLNCSKLYFYIYIFI